MPAPKLTREAMVKSLSGGGSRAINDALFSAAYHDPDGKWTMDQCLKFLKHSDSAVRRSASTCLEVLAVCHKCADIHKALPALYQVLESADRPLRGEVELSISIIEQSLGNERSG